MQTSIQQPRPVSAIAPSASLRVTHGVDPGAALDLEPCEGYVASGVYLVELGGSVDLYEVARTPPGGYALKSDGFTFYVDPDASSPTGFVDRESERPASLTFRGRLLRAARAFAHPLHPS